MKALLSALFLPASLWAGIDMKFQDNSTNEQWWECWRRDSENSEWQMVLKWDSETIWQKEVRVNFADETTTGGETYHYRIRAGNKYYKNGAEIDGFSGWSNILMATDTPEIRVFEFPPNGNPRYLGNDRPHKQ